MDLVDKSAFYIRVFSRNKYICLDAVYSISFEIMEDLSQDLALFQKR